MFYKIESHKFPTIVNHNNPGMSLEYILGIEFYIFLKKYTYNTYQEFKIIGVSKYVSTWKPKTQILNHHIILDIAQ